MKKFLGFVDKYLIWVLAVGGIAAVSYGAWFQTEGFTFAEVPLTTVLSAALLGAVLGAAIMSYLVTLSKKKTVGRKKLVRTELAAMIRGYMVCFALCMWIVYTAKTTAFFYFGIGGMAFTIVTAWYYMIWGWIEKSKAGKKQEDGKAGSGK